MVLPVPTNVTAVAQSTSEILISWDAVTEADAYDVERDTVIVAIKITATSYLDGGLDPSTEYTYRVRSARLTGGAFTPGFSSGFE